MDRLRPVDLGFFLGQKRGQDCEGFISFKVRTGVG